MKKIAVLLVVVLLTALSQATAQCSCACSTGSSLLSDLSGAISMDRNRVVVEASAEHVGYHPHVHADGHVHGHGASTEVPGLAMQGMTGATLSLRYGITNRVTVMATLPYAALHALPMTMHGFGDVGVTGLVKALDKERITLTGLGGVELPTGKQLPDVLASDVVIGSGSIDAFGGLMAAFARSRWLYRGNGVYKINNRNTDGLKYGNVATATVSVGYGNADKMLCTPPAKAKPTWLISGIALVEHNGPAYWGKRRLNNTGGTVLSAGGGASITVGRVTIPISIVLPLYRQLNGEQHLTAFKARMGAAVTF